MLNQFYKYMAEKLRIFLEKEKLKGGERFYLQFDHIENVRDFYQILKSMELSEEFIYQHEQGTPYITFCININDIKVVVAATLDGVTPDFLVTLRNQVSEQVGQWDKTGLISISHLSLDSIQGGSKDLQNKGMPFNTQQITHYIKEELKNNHDFSLAEKELFKFHLDRKLEDIVVQTSLWDYAEVIGLINKGKIEDSDFRSLSLFPDKELGKDSNLKPKDIEYRLQENARLFELVQRIHDYETLDTELEKFFEDKMITKLKRDTWFENDFPQVRNAFGTGKSIQYVDSLTKKLNKHLSFWERPHLETKVGHRKRHIIIFNESKLPSVEMQFEFDDFLKKQFINKKSAPFADTSGKKLKVILPAHDDRNNFYQIKYKHNNENSSGFEFNICIVPFSADQLEGIETMFEIKVNGSDSRLFLKYHGEITQLGRGENVVEHVLTEAYETIDKNIDDKLLIDMDASAWEDDSLVCNIHVSGTFLQFEFKDTDTRSTPIGASRVWKLKRERREHFHLENERLKQGTYTYYPFDDFKEKLHLEKEWITNHHLYLVDGIEPEHFHVSNEIRSVYYAYLEYFEKNGLLPSLAYMDDDLKVLAMDYVRRVTEAINGIEEHSLLNAEQKNLFRLGMVSENGKIWMTPLHPINVAYQLKLQDEVGDEELENTILERLHPNNLVPFIYSEKDELYRPTLEGDFSEWHEYEPEKLISVGTANEFLATVVEEKMNQFVHHFDYLFLESARSPLLLNVIEIHNDKEVVRGISTFLKKQLETYGPNGMLPIEIALYRDVEAASAFEIFSTLQTPAEVEAEFDLNLKSKEFDSVDVLRLIREHIKYFKITMTSNLEFQYAHISFFKLPTQDIDASHQVDKMETGIALNGLISSVVAISSESDYRSGYGILHAPKETNPLIDMATSYNELSFNMQNEGKNSYSKNKSIVMSTSTEGKSLLEKLYKASAWVTFIDPGVDLDFFQKSSPNLLVIHYNDQHTSSDRYDAITVTDKSSQYKKVIADYIGDKIRLTDNNIDMAIKSFNSINGQWLLSIIGSKGHFAREKVSIVSAMKYLEGYFNHSNITWIPISLEEILRVSSAVKLNKVDGIFSAKNLNSGGKHSDDILMMGLEQKDGSLYLHIYPVEVKIGRLQTSKAATQIAKTTKLFKQYLMDRPGETSFKKKFFRNFFTQMLLSNAKKLHANGLWSVEKYEHIHELKPELMNDEFKISTHLETYIGEGAVLTFRKDHGFRSALLEDGVLKLTFIEEDAFAGLAYDMDKILDKMRTGYMDFDPEKMLYALYNPEDVDVTPFIYPVLEEEQASDLLVAEDSSDYEDESGVLEVQDDDVVTIDDRSVALEVDVIEDGPEIIEDQEADVLTEGESDVTVNQVNDDATEVTENPSDDGLVDDTTEITENPIDNNRDESVIGSSVEDKTSEKLEDVEESLPEPSRVYSLSDIRIPLGTASGSNQVIHWEFGHPGLANRHLFITGRSGQGKTYFIQCLLLELANKGISSIIIDYTDGFKSSQLEDEFKETLGSKLEQFIVLAKKFPVNPFKRNHKELDEGITILEDDSDVAERMKNVIGSIYPTLGIQQLNSIYQAVMKGMSIHDEKMNLMLLRELLEEDGSGPAKTALSQMNLLIDKNPFDYNQDFDWSFLEKQKGKVFVIQLTGYSPDVQKMITEFILWDLWYYKLQHGNKNLPFPVILDESQRLDFSSDSPSAKILVEGRKFGWSGWFATQFLKGGFSTDQVSRLQNSSVKIFFAPMENEVNSIASSITQDPAQRKEWESRLTNLRKGQCIVYGPVQDREGNLMPVRPYLVDILALDKR
ncbi:DNA phosphorothioation-dependent restriction protein DptH [Peribacillus alkalitolerans]|uniref:DNA phosphorothioation-dependent restriction protein DptH n=1 Tax=Peribacillus alkalitolerans TaxID=1550385 RepID=UPI001F07197D|nr:DNA phosphorothioation-dependent restriction protein DptH [Peribacillus alkalitolerans]